MAGRHAAAPERPRMATGSRSRGQHRARVDVPPGDTAQHRAAPRARRRDEPADTYGGRPFGHTGAHRAPRGHREALPESAVRRHRAGSPTRSPRPAAPKPRAAVLQDYETTPRYSDRRRAAGLRDRQRDGQARRTVEQERGAGQGRSFRDQIRSQPIDLWFWSRPVPTTAGRKSVGFKPGRIPRGAMAGANPLPHSHTRTKPMTGRLGKLAKRSTKPAPKSIGR